MDIVDNATEPAKLEISDEENHNPETRNEASKVKTEMKCIPVVSSVQAETAEQVSLNENAKSDEAYAGSPRMQNQESQCDATEKEIPSIQVENSVKEEATGDTEGREDVKSNKASIEEPPPMQQKPVGRKGKKKQKWKKLDMNEVSDIPAETYKPEPKTQPYKHSQSGSTNVWDNRSSPALKKTTYEQRISHQAQQMSVSSGPRPVVNEVALSKALVRVLRHGKPPIPMDSKGYAFIEEILSHRDFQKFGISVRDVIKLSETNDKKRFEIMDEAGKKKIRATQGHSLVLLIPKLFIIVHKLQDFGLTPITDPHKHNTVLHGTYKTNWRSIKKQGLARFNRTHIHFAVGHIGETHVTSGMRVTCDIIIYLDMEKAMKDGIKFYESSNNVVLTEGDRNGFILPRYFKRVTRWSQDKYGSDVWTDIQLDQQ